MATEKRLTTHPKRQARRQRAADRFSIDKRRAKEDPAYATAKAVEAKALGL